MKKLLLALSLLVGVVSVSHAYSFFDLKEDFIKDTKEVFLKEARIGYFHDFLEDKFPDRHKFGLSTTLIAYKFIGVDPIAIYTPSSANAIVEGGLAFPIRLGYIPIGNGRLLKDLAPANREDNLIDRIKIGLYTSQNLSTGRFGFGWNITFGF